MTEKTGEPSQRQILILCVDRDSDLGTKAEIKTPLIGRTANLDAAVSLALKDPEEADANAMFEAVRLLDGLIKEKKSHETFEIATISGTELGGVGADRKLVSELVSVLEGFKANEVILVTDGYTDEAVLPLVESRVPVSSVRRIVVKHSESIEETAQLFGKYLRTLVSNPKYSRIALGLPGTLILIWLLLAAFKVENFAFYYGMAILLVVGSIFIVKGFGIDRAAKDFFKWAREYSPPSLPVQISNYATIAGILCIAVSAYSGYSNAVNSVPAQSDIAAWLSKMPALSAYFLQGAIYLVVAGICAILVGRSVRMYFAHDVRILRNGVLIVSVAWSSVIFQGASDVLLRPEPGLMNLIFYIVVGILIAIASVLVTLIIHRSYKSFFAESEEKGEEFEERQPKAKEE